MNYFATTIGMQQQSTIPQLPSSAFQGYNNRTPHSFLSGYPLHVFQGNQDHLNLTNGAPSPSGRRIARAAAKVSGVLVTPPRWWSQVTVAVDLARFLRSWHAAVNRPCRHRNRNVTIGSGSGSVGRHCDSPNG